MDERADADKSEDAGAGSGQRPLRLRLFDWSGFIKDGALFVNLVGGSVAVGLGALGTLPPWMIQSNRLLFLSLAFAFARVWKTVREERESGDLWEMLGEEVSSSGGGMGQMKDAVFEIPYLFAIVFMPLSAVSLQTFSLCLLVFYVTDNFYNLAILQGLSGEENDRPTPGLDRAGLRGRARGAAGRTLRRVTRGRFEPAIAILGDTMRTFLPIGRPHRNTIDREVLTRFFGRRVVFNRVAILVLAIVAGVALLGSRDVAEEVGFAAVLGLMVMELVLEPSRLLDAQYEPDEPDESAGHLLLWTTPAGTRLDAESRAVLDRIHEDAFPVREQQFTMKSMLAKTGRHGYRLLVLTERASGAGNHEVAGYLCLQARPELEVAYFWYLAVDKKRRGNGLGRELVQLAIEVVEDRWPSVQAVFLEAGDDVKDFYRHLGFWQATGVDYRIPANGAPDESVPYFPMFYPLRRSRDRVDVAFVKKAVRAMAADSFTNRRDKRLKALVNGFGELKPMAPPENAGS